MKLRYQYILIETDFRAAETLVMLPEEIDSSNLILFRGVTALQWIFADEVWKNKWVIEL